MSKTIVERCDITVENRSNGYEDGRYAVIEISFRAVKEKVSKVDTMAIENAIRDACDKFIESNRVAT